MSQLSSGLVGLVVGAVLGLVLTVLFEDNLKSLRSTTISRVRMARARATLPSPVAEFHLGPLRTTVLIVEGDGQQVIDEQAVRVMVDPTDVTLPDDVARLRQEVIRPPRSRGSTRLPRRPTPGPP